MNASVPTEGENPLRTADLLRPGAALGDQNGPVAWLQYLGTRAIVGGANLLPRRMRRGAARLTARMVWRVFGRHTRAARDFLSQALGHEIGEAEREAMILRSYQHIFEIALDVETLDRELNLDDIEHHFKLEFCTDAWKALEEERGCLLITPHLGNWEAASLVLPRIGFDPLYVVLRPQRNRPLSRYLQTLRERRGIWQIPRHGALTYAIKCLRGGGSLVMFADQRARIGPVIVPFFGRLATCEQTPALLQRRAKVPILIAACLNTERPDRFRLVIPKVLWPAHERGRTIEETVATINDEMETMIRANPEQYLWLHDRYKNAPPHVPEPALADG